MKFSIIVPTYNSEKWIQQCINSILAQTFTGFDLIVLDSGSTDGTVSWIQSINDNRIKIYNTDKRLSIEANWTRILDVPKNEFMTIVGHDDILYSSFLDEINKLITVYPDAVLYQTHFNFIDKDGKLLRKCQPMKPIINDDDLLKSILTNSFDITATGFVFRSKEYDAVGGIPLYPNLLYADIELWFNMLQKGFMAVAEKTCFEFRFHPENTSKTFGAFRMKAFDMVVNFLFELKTRKESYKNIIDKLGKQFLVNYVTGACHKLVYVPKGERSNISFNQIIALSKTYAQKLLATGTEFKPELLPGVIIAKIVDSNTFSRNLFLLYKKFSRRLY